MKRIIIPFLFIFLVSCNKVDQTSSSSKESSSTSSSNVVKDLSLNEAKDIINDILINYSSYLNKEKKFSIEIHTVIPSLVNSSSSYKANTKKYLAYDYDLKLIHSNLARYIDFKWVEGTEEEYYYQKDGFFYIFHTYYKAYKKYNNSSESMINGRISDFMKEITKQYENLENILDFIIDKENNESNLIDDYVITSTGPGNVSITCKAQDYINVKSIEINNYLPINSSIKEFLFINDYPQNAYEVFTFSYDAKLEVPNISEYRISEN